MKLTHPAVIIPLKRGERIAKDRGLLIFDK